MLGYSILELHPLPNRNDLGVLNSPSTDVVPLRHCAHGTHCSPSRLTLRDGALNPH